VNVRRPSRPPGGSAGTAELPGAERGDERLASHSVPFAPKRSGIFGSAAAPMNRRREQHSCSQARLGTQHISAETAARPPLRPDPQLACAPGGRTIDYRIYHTINQFVYHHAWLGRGLSALETWAVPVIAVATFALWLLARPGGTRKWKLASACALGSAALALLLNQVIGNLWDRQRPFAAHPSAHVWGSRSHDPSFPSDHASAAFAIAFAVLLFDRAVGTVFLAAAIIVGVGRVFIGAHYPLDVVAGCLVGLASALLLVRVARPVVAWLVALVERFTDPIVAPIWRLRAHD
jgi:undecaprenyl-diphosphatase